MGKGGGDTTSPLIEQVEPQKTFYKISDLENTSLFLEIYSKVDGAKSFDKTLNFGTDYADSNKEIIKTIRVDVNGVEDTNTMIGCRTDPTKTFNYICISVFLRDNNLAMGLGISISNNNITGVVAGNDYGDFERVGIDLYSGNTIATITGAVSTNISRNKVILEDGSMIINKGKVVDSLMQLSI